MKAICEGCSGADHPEDACVLSVEKLRNENVVLPLSCPWGRSERSCRWRLVPEDMLIANNESLENAPPEIKSIKPLNPPLASVITSSNNTKLTPGTVIKHPSLNITISNNVYNIFFLISGVFIAFFNVLNN